MRYKIILWRLALIIAIAAFCLFAWHKFGETGFSYDWHWNRIWRYFVHYGPDGIVVGPMFKGMGMTIAITLLGLAMAIPCGVIAGLFILSPWPFCILAARFYVAVWRATPLLLQLFIAYFLLSPLLHLPPFWMAVLTLAIFEGAYFAEIFRAGILGIHKNQWEAALSLGFNLRQTFVLVIFPQAARDMLPSITNQAIAVLKDSTLVSAIAVADLAMQSQAIVAESFLAFETWLLAAAIYLFLALFISLPALFIEKNSYLKRDTS